MSDTAAGKGGEPGAEFVTGDQVDHFKIMRLLGQGGMGSVYLARDTKLGRKVALKVVRPEFIDTEETLDRFFFEARATARFSHPHIVTVFAVGEFQGSPYLALEYLEGQTLRQRMDQERASLRQSLRFGWAIAAALEEAHSHNILHRDLKPENVLIPGDGRLRVVDFGLAKMLKSADEAFTDTISLADAAAQVTSFLEQHETKGTELKGTPLYMAPEQWMSAKISKTTDVWALGVILYELVTGTRPFMGKTLMALAGEVCGAEMVPPDQISDEVPPAVSELICRCLRKEATKRPQVEQVFATLEELLAEGRPRLSEEQNPFPGLLPFSERHADSFFGRGAETAAFLERLRVEPTLPVVGASGAGKSSFIQAGVIPRLREQGPWSVFSLRPGRHPFQTLAGCLLGGENTTTRQRMAFLRTAVSGTLAAGSLESKEQVVEPTSRAEEKQHLAQRLEETPGKLSLLLHGLAERENSKVLLFVDQLEEVYTLVEDEDQRIRFTGAICTAADDPQCPVRVVFTLRDDFLGRMAEGALARETLGRVTVLRSPAATALEEILVKPVEAAGYRYEDPELVQEMISAVQGEAACLPLLQFATQMLWQQRDTKERVLRRSTYEAMGGVSGALARHADSVLQGLSPAEVSVARELFLRLVTPEGTKRVLPRAQLVEGLAEEAPSILGRLVGAKAILARKARHGGGDEAEMELVHDSLIGCWDQLARWIDGSREDMAFLAEVGQAAELWENRGSREEEVWQGGALGEALRRMERCSTEAPEQVVRFLEAGKDKAERARRGKRLRRAAIFGALVVVALVSAIVALVFAEQEKEVRLQKNRAEEKGAEARHQLAQSHREGARAALAQGNLLEARAKIRSALEIEISPDVRALWWRLSKTPLFWKKKLGSTIHGVALAPDGKTMAAACQDKTVYLFDVDTMSQRILRGHEDQVFTVSYSPDGGRVATGDMGGQVRLWDLSSGTVRKLSGHKGLVLALGFRPDGKILATAGFDGTVRLWKVATGAQQKLLPGSNRNVRCLAFSPDGTRLATGSRDAKVRIWDLSSGGMVKQTLSGHQGTVSSVAFNPDGTHLASGGHDKTIRLWDLSNGRPSKVIRGHEGRVRAVLFHPQGKLLASASWDKTIRLWSFPSGSPRGIIRGHTAAVKGLDFSREGKLLATGSGDGTVRIWKVDQGIKKKHAGGHRAGVMAVSISPDGKLLASGSDDRIVRLWDVATGATVRVLRGHTAAVKSVAFSPDGKFLASAGQDKTIRLWDAATSVERMVLVNHRGTVFDLAFSPDGVHLASGSKDRTVRLWDINTYKEVRRFEGHRSAVFVVSFGPRGRKLASGDADNNIQIWDTATGEGRKLPGEHKGWVYGLSFSPDGQHLVSGSWDGSIRSWNLAGGTSEEFKRSAARVYRVAFFPDGEWIGATGSDHTARLWAMSSAEEVVIRGHRSEVNDLSISADGRLVATSGDDGTVRLWHTRTGKPFWHAPALLASSGQMFSHRGWESLRGGVAAADKPWHRAIQKTALQVSESSDGEVVCSRTNNGMVEAWETAGTARRLFRERLDGLEEVLAIPGGCVTLSKTGAGVITSSSEYKDLIADARAISWADGKILVAAQRKVLTFDKAGKRLAPSFDVDVGVSAISRVKDWLVLGFREGSIELIPVESSKKKPSFAFEGVPSSAVTRMMQGPEGTLVVGYENGLMGIWRLENGALLERTQLHGSVMHLAYKDNWLYAATDLGDRAVQDLGIFQKPRCALLREVWQQVPVLWEGGLPVLRQPEKNHPCNTR